MNTERISVLNAEKTTHRLIDKDHKKPISNLYYETFERGSLVKSAKKRQDKLFEGLEHILRKIKFMVNAQQIGGENNKDNKNEETDLLEIEKILNMLEELIEIPPVTKLFIQKENDYVELFSSSGVNVPAYIRDFSIYEQTFDTSNVGKSQYIDIQKAPVVESLKEQVNNLYKNEFMEFEKQRKDILNQLTAGVEYFMKNPKKYVFNMVTLNKIKTAWKEFKKVESTNLQYLKEGVTMLRDKLITINNLLDKEVKVQEKNRDKANRFKYEKDYQIREGAGKKLWVVDDFGIEHELKQQNNGNSKFSVDYNGQKYYMYLSGSNTVRRMDANTTGGFSYTYNAEHVKKLKYLLESNIHFGISKRLNDIYVADSSNDPAPMKTNTNESFDSSKDNKMYMYENIFDTLLNNYEYKRKDAKTVQDVMKLDSEFLSYLELLGLNLIDIFKINIADKMAFIIIIMLLHLITFSCIEFLIDNDYLDTLLSIITVYTLFYLMMFTIIIIIFNNAGYRSKVILNYLNTDFNASRLIIHYLFMVIFLIVIVILTQTVDSMNMNIREKEDKLSMLYRIEMISTIMFVFAGIFVMVI